MSTRALRKLQGRLDEKIEENAENSASDSSESVITNAHNRFTFLVESDEENELDRSGDENKHPAHISSEKLKKKPKKSKRKKNTPVVGKETPLFPVDFFADSDFLLEKATKCSLEEKADDPKTILLIESDLFKIEYRNLNVENELKRIFGKAVGSLAVGDDEGDSRRMQRRLDQKMKLRKPGTLAGRIVQPKSLSHGHIAKTGLSMVLEKRTPATGVNQFKFEHNVAYQEAQLLFWDAVDKMNPEIFVAILKEHPFHVSTLMQMSEIYRVNEDFGTARDLLERAIATCESVFHPMFNIATSKSRLDYRQQENRPFFLALLKHMQYTCQRVCFRTALELCKLIYSLDPDEDPLGMLLYLDHLCLRSKQYDFFINVYHVLEAKKNLSQLPNFVYSLAIALFLKSSDKRKTPEEAQRLLDEADDKLKLALIRFPTFLPILLDKCGIEPDKAVASCAAFSSAELAKDGSGLKTLLHLYVGRCFSVWKDPGVMAWLERSVKKLVDNKSFHESNPDFLDYRTNRSLRYHVTPLNVCRHVVLSMDEEAKDAKFHLPVEIREKSVENHDPLPPNDSRAAYGRPQRGGLASGAGGGSLLGTFLRSLLPNYNPEAEAERQADEGAGPAPDLHQSVRNVLRAVRELLVEFQPEPAPRQDNGEDQHEGGLGDDPNDWVDEFD